jgi:hypothetical protein
LDLLIKKYLMPWTKNAENPTFKMFYRKISITGDQQNTSGERRAAAKRPRRTGPVAKRPTATRPRRNGCSETPHPLCNIMWNQDRQTAILKIYLVYRLCKNYGRNLKEQGLLTKMIQQSKYPVLSAIEKLSNKLDDDVR